MSKEGLFAALTAALSAGALGAAFLWPHQVAQEAMVDSGQGFAGAGEAEAPLEKVQESLPNVRPELVSASVLEAKRTRPDVQRALTVIYPTYEEGETLPTYLSGAIVMTDPRALPRDIYQTPERVTDPRRPDQKN